MSQTKMSQTKNDLDRILTNAQALHQKFENE